MKFRNDALKGILLAVLATIVWSGNFVVARGVINEISPVALAFLRWATACIALLPLCWNSIPNALKWVRQYFWYFLLTAFTGVTLFNTLVYVAGHYSPAINLALIGTTSSPIFSIVLAYVFLKEKMSRPKMIGLFICIVGILMLISKGSITNLVNFHFSTGDLWVIGGALSFAIYNILVRKKPSGIDGTTFLFICFTLGTILLLPAYFIESQYVAPTKWSYSLLLILLYLGVGASVIAFLCWNIAISKLGAGKTALFGNLIPVFSVMEAMLFLGEQLSYFHVIGGVMVIGGLIVANLHTFRPTAAINHGN